MKSVKTGIATIVLLASVGLALSGCVVYDPAPYPVAQPAYYYPAPAYGYGYGYAPSVGVTLGGWGHGGRGWR